MKSLVHPTLLEKMAIAEREESGRVEEWSARTGATAAEATTYSALRQVLENLTNVLGTRRRHGSVVDDLGLGDYDDPAVVNTSVDFLGRQIQQVVARYEPRILGPTVEPAARDASRRIRYRLTGAVDGAAVKIDVIFDTAYCAVVSVTAA